MLLYCDNVNLVERMSNEEIAVMWARHYPRRNDQPSWLLLSALTNIIKGRLILSSPNTYGDDLAAALPIFLHQLHISMDEFRQIGEMR